MEGNWPWAGRRPFKPQTVLFEESNESDRQTAKKLGINRHWTRGCAVSICLNGASWHG
jgi:hypothetical protein